ncbi:MAG: MBL fold metallo-hydrolase [Epsilonproteobacteria bacterium]|nr:MBL fold metallo-hydrolase [Campylobacterota bacterium]
MKFEFLGTADTGGIPLHMCSCEVCEKARLEKTTNRSTSAFLELDDGSVILFDAGCDTLMDRFNTTPIRAVFLTHFHADHCLGLIRLRKSAHHIPCYIPDDQEGFGDLLVHKNNIEYRILTPFESIHIEGVEIVAVPLEHSKLTQGFVLFTCKKRVAYLTDCGGMRAESLAYLKKQKLDYLFLDAAYTPSFDSDKHLNWESAQALIEAIAPKKGYLIHASCHTLLGVQKRGVVLTYPYIEQGFCLEV